MVIFRVCLNFYHLAPSGKFNFIQRYIFRRTASSSLELPAIFSIRCEQLLAVPSLLSKVFYSILVTDETIQSSCPKLNFLAFAQT